MRKAVDYLRAHPIIAVALLVGVVGVLLLWPRPQPVSTPSPEPAPPPAPEAAPPSPPPAGSPPGPPSGEPGTVPAPTPTPRRVAGPVDAGRPDPFQPLVVQASGAPGVPVPPPAPLPPPLFPGQGQPGQPGQPAEPPPPPPKAASRAEVIGVMGDNGGVAVVRLDGQTYVVSRGDVILDKIRVTRIDAGRGVVVLEEDGEQFERVIEGRSI